MVYKLNPVGFNTISAIEVTQTSNPEHPPPLACLHIPHTLTKSPMNFSRLGHPPSKIPVQTPCLILRYSMAYPLGYSIEYSMVYPLGYLMAYPLGYSIGYSHGTSQGSMLCLYLVRSIIHSLRETHRSALPTFHKVEVANPSGTSTHREYGCRRFGNVQGN